MRHEMLAQKPRRGVVERRACDRTRHSTWTKAWLSQAIAAEGGQGYRAWARIVRNSTTLCGKISNVVSLFAPNGRA